MTKERLIATALLFLAAVLWSLGGVLIKSIQWNPMAIAGGRSAIAAVVILFWAGWPRRLFSRIELASAFAYAGTVILFVIATRLSTAANAIFLQYTAPIYVAALSHWYLGERALRIDWLVIAIALGGIGLFFMDQMTPAASWGNVCGLGSGLCFAWMILMLRRQKEGSPIVSLLLGNVLTALIGAPFMFGAVPDPRSCVALLLLGVFQLGLPYVLYSIAIKRVTAMEAVLIPLFEPVLNPLWVMLLVGEKPGAWAMVGAAAVLGAVALRGVLIVIALRPRTARTS